MLTAFQGQTTMMCRPGLAVREKRGNPFQGSLRLGGAAHPRSAWSCFTSVSIGSRTLRCLDSAAPALPHAGEEPWTMAGVGDTGVLSQFLAGL